MSLRPHEQRSRIHHGAQWPNPPHLPPPHFLRVSWVHRLQIARAAAASSCPGLQATAVRPAAATHLQSYTPTVLRSLATYSRPALQFCFGNTSRTLVHAHAGECETVISSLRSIVRSIVTFCWQGN